MSESAQDQTAANLVVIEDEPLVRDLLVFNLQHVGYRVSSAGTCAEAETCLKPGVDLAIMDVMLPDGDGFQLTRKARDSGLTFPILLLTARGDTQAKVRGLDCGADDYLTKPFDLAELLARVRALLRRRSQQFAPDAANVLEFGSYRIRFDTGIAQTNEGEVSLSDKELKLMSLFARNENKALSRADILEDVWGMTVFPTDRTVDNFILRLRRLFEPDPENPVYFVTLRGRGYLFRRSPS